MVESVICGAAIRILSLDGISIFPRLLVGKSIRLNQSRDKGSVSCESRLKLITNFFLNEELSKIN